MTIDIIGTELTAAETELLDLYEGLKRLIARDDLAPSTRAAALTALAPVAVAVTDLGLVFEHLTDLGA